MEDLGALDQSAVLLHLVSREHDIRSGVSVEGEVSVSVGELLDKRERRMDLLVHFETCHVDALLLCLGLEEPSEHVIAHLADESSLFAGFVEHCKDVAGCSPGICLKQIVSLLADPVLCKVDQKFSKRSYINFLFNAHCSITFLMLRLAGSPSGSPADT